MAELNDATLTRDGSSMFPSTLLTIWRASASCGSRSSGTFRMSAMRTDIPSSGGLAQVVLSTGVSSKEDRDSVTVLSVRLGDHPALVSNGL
jgi:hypothetical protein